MAVSRKLFVIGAACALAVGVAACGSDDDGGGAASAAAADLGEQTQAKIVEAVDGVFGPPPSESPAPEPGKNIWFVVLGVTYDWSTPGSIHEAAKRMGWMLTQFDGKFSTDTVVSGIRQAIADDADGIILALVDCPNVKAALRDAEEAGIPVVSTYAYDCNEAKEGEPSLFDATVNYLDPSNPDVPMSYPDFLREVWAEAQALAIINGTGGEAKIIDVYESDLQVTVEQDKGVRESLEEHCPDCEVVETVEFTGAEIGPRLQQKIEQALLRNPEANAIFSPYDAVTQITMPAVRASGRGAEVYHVGAEGEAVVMDGIRKGDGTVDAAVGLAPDWEAFAALDALNRLFAGEEPGPAGGFASGNGTQIIDGENNLPSRGERYEPPVDFREAYYEAWGLK